MLVRYFSVEKWNVISFLIVLTPWVLSNATFILFWTCHVIMGVNCKKSQQNDSIFSTSTFLPVVAMREGNKQTERRRREELGVLLLPDVKKKKQKKSLCLRHTSTDSVFYFHVSSGVFSLSPPQIFGALIMGFGVWVLFDNQSFIAVLRKCCEHTCVLAPTSNYDKSCVRKYSALLTRVLSKQWAENVGKSWNSCPSLCSLQGFYPPRLIPT